MNIDQRSAYTFHHRHALKNGAKKAKKVGTTVVSCEVRRYRDLRNLGDELAYQVLCTQRIVIPNATQYQIGAQDIQNFVNYPAILSSQTKLTSASGTCELVRYAPKTLNSAVETSRSAGQSTSGSTTHEHTSGSSNSQSNTFGASASVGFFGDLPTGGLSVDYSHQWGSSHSHSHSQGQESGHVQDDSAGEQMSVKDWGCCARLDAEAGAPTWVWGQEYPWNVLKFRNTLAGSSITLPDYIAHRLYDAKQAFPPSQLSEFGVDFTMRSVWIVKPNGSAGATLEYTIGYCTATHSVGTGQHASVTANINSEQTFEHSFPSFDLMTYGLDAIRRQGSRGGAVVGFLPQRFVTAPEPAAAGPGSTSVASPTPFCLLSSANDLLVRDTTDYSALTLTSADVGAGFRSSDTALTGTFTPHCTSLQVTVSFKVLEVGGEWALYMKHWKTGASGFTLEFKLNGVASTLTRYVDSEEAEGGDDNLLVLSLRNQNYASVDYHDFLKVGLNTIQVTISPIGGAVASSEYQLRAVMIDQT